MRAATLLATTVLAGIAVGSANAAPPVTIVSPSSLTVQAGEAKPTTVTVRNDGASAVTLTLKAVLGEGSAQVKPATITVDALTPVAVPITVRADKSTRDATGAVVFSATGSPAALPAVLPLEIDPEQHHDNAAALLIFLTAYLALLLVVGRMLTAKVRDPFGPANWKYSESWASSLTLVGALLATVLAAGVLPEKLGLFSKAGYSAFNVFFGMLVLVAPLVYAALQERVEDAADGTPQYQGSTLAFGVASFVTVWGVFGELTTVGLLFRELEKAGGLSTWLVWFSYAVLALIVAAAIAYVLKRMRQILEAPPADRGSGLAPSDSKGAWSLL